MPGRGRRREQKAVIYRVSEPCRLTTCAMVLPAECKNILPVSYSSFSIASSLASPDHWRERPADSREETSRMFLFPRILRAVALYLLGVTESSSFSPPVPGLFCICLVRSSHAADAARRSTPFGVEDTIVRKAVSAPASRGGAAVVGRHRRVC